MTNIKRWAHAVWIGPLGERSAWLRFWWRVATLSLIPLMLNIGADTPGWTALVLAGFSLGMTSTWACAMLWTGGERHVGTYLRRISIAWIFPAMGLGVLGFSLLIQHEMDPAVLAYLIPLIPVLIVWALTTREQETHA